MAAWTGTPALPLLLAGDIPNGATDWAGILAAIHGLTDAWTSYTPILTAATVNPTNYTGTARWIGSNKFGLMQFQVTAGAAFTAGTGTYSISLPVTAQTALAVTAGAVRLFDSSTGNAILGARPAVNTATTFGLQATGTYAGALSNIGSAFPWVWAASDIIDGFIVFEAA